MENNESNEEKLLRGIVEDPERSLVGFYRINGHEEAIIVFPNGRKLILSKTDGELIEEAINKGDDAFVGVIPPQHIPIDPPGEPPEEPIPPVPPVPPVPPIIPPVPPVPPITPEKIAENGRKEKEEHEDDKRKFNPKWLIPIAILLIAIPFIARSCGDPSRDGDGKLDGDSDPKPVIVSVENQSYGFTYKDVDSPAAYTEGTVGVAGQEGMTIDGIYPDEHWYDWVKHADAEDQASKFAYVGEKVREEINECMQKLDDPNLPNSQKANVFRRLNRLSIELQDMFRNNSDFMEEYTKKAIDEVNAHPDNRTDNETKALESALAIYLKELGFSEFNVSNISVICQLLDDGFDITYCDVFREIGDIPDGSGDYEVDTSLQKITYADMKDLSKNTDKKGLKGLWERIKSWFKTKQAQRDETKPKNDSPTNDGGRDEE